MKTRPRTRNILPRHYCSLYTKQGLEYENTSCYRFISDHRADYPNCRSVSKNSLDADTLDYRRAKDKSDKSLEGLQILRQRPLCRR